MKKMYFSFQKQSASEPLYKQVADYLHQLILSGKLVKGEQLPSEVDLAEMLNVSRLTLRKSLSILMSRELIAQIPHCGTFVAEQKEKHLRIGLLYRRSEYDFGGIYGNQILLNLCQATTHYTNVEIVFLNCCNFTIKEIAERIAKCNCDGYIVPFGTPFFSQILDLPKYDTLPVVYINKNKSELKGLRFNVALDEDPFKNVLEYLKQNGHERIAYISAQSDVEHLLERNASFLKHCPEQAIPIIKHPKCAWFDFARNETIRLCRSKNRPTAILTSGLAFTTGVWHGLMESRMSVPEDLSLIGFDNAGDFYPRLATVEQPLQQMTEKALSLICETIRGKVYRNHTFLYKETFIDRGSIKKV